MIAFTTDEYRQAELIIMRRDSIRHWRTHRNLFVAGMLLLLPAALIAGQLWLFAIVAAAWLAGLVAHYFHAIRWFDRAKEEFQGRVSYVAQQLHRTS
jgi:hypothetical protein